MKKNSIFFISVAMMATILLSHSSEAQSTNEGPELISFRVKNNSLLPRHFKLVSYEPGITGNGTQTFLLLPHNSKDLKFREGTRLFLVSQTQIDTVMSGNALTGKPWYTIGEKDKNKTIMLLRK